MQEIINALGGVVASITQFFSYIAPGYITLLVTLFFALLPFVIFKLIEKAVKTHA